MFRIKKIPSIAAPLFLGLINFFLPIKSLHAEQLSVSALLGGSIIQPDEPITNHATGTAINLAAQPSPGYYFTGWKSNRLPDIASPRASSTTLTLSTDTSVLAAFSPLGGIKIENGDFSQNLAGWSIWTVSGTVNASATGPDSALEITGTGFDGGVYQQFNTGGAGNVVIVTGYWSGTIGGASDAWAEVWAINGDRVPVDGAAEIEGVSDSIPLFKNPSEDDWNGAIPLNSDQGEYRISFVAADDRATLILRVGNDGSGSTRIRFDNIEARCVPPPGTVADPPEGFIIRSVEFPLQGIDRIAEHPLTGDIYAIHDRGANELYRIDVNEEPMSATLVEEIGNVGIEFDRFATGLIFDGTGDLYVISRDGDLLKGDYQPLTDTFVWSSFFDLNDTLGIDPVGDHGFGGLAIDHAKGVMYINSGAVERGRGNTEPEPDNGFNTRILRIGLDAMGLEVFCRGIRHEFGIDVRSDGSLFGVENSNDCHSAENVHFLEEGKHYGYPFNFGSDRSANDTGLFACEETPALGGPFSPSLANYGPDARPLSSQPGYIDGGVYWGLHPHSSPNGIAFYEPEEMDPEAALFPGEFHERAFVVRFGQQVGDSPNVGYDVISMRLDDASGGFVCDAFLEQVGRPVDVLVHSNGRLYFVVYSPVADGPAIPAGNSVLYEVSFDAPTAVEDWEEY